MSDPVAIDPALIAHLVVPLFRALHSELRSTIAPLDDAAVNWAPAPGTNSVATTLVHLVGSEAETLRCAAGRESHRHRDAEFSVGEQTVHDLHGVLAGADALLDDLAPLLDAVNLVAPTSLPTLSPEDRRPGWVWLIGNYGHAREHLGQIQLTARLAARR